MTGHVHAEDALTKNQTLVMEALEKASKPLSAYTILDQLRSEGLRAPLQIYRALDKLVEFGLAHRLESMNAFVACRHSGCESHQPAAFMICEKCGDVREVSDTVLTDHLKRLAEQGGFVLNSSIVELRGQCGNC